MSSTGGLILHILREFGGNLFGFRNKCNSNRQLDGQVVVITGGNTGIGKETAYELSLRNAKVIIGCRDLSRADSAIQDILKRNPKATISALKLDLSSLTSVRHFAKQLEERVDKIDILINNAGIAGCKDGAKTEDGFEMHIGTNHLGHFLLTLSLISLLQKAPKARVLNVTSDLHMAGKIYLDNINLENGEFGQMKGYSQSKLANILFTRELAKRLGDNSTINTYAVHPGVIKTELGKEGPHQNLFNIWKSMPWFLNVKQGCQTSLYCALEESLDNETGHYYQNCLREDNMVSTATDDTTAEKLWDLSSDLVKLEKHLQLSA